MKITYLSESNQLRQVYGNLEFQRPQHPRSLGPSKRLVWLLESEWAFSGLNKTVGGSVGTFYLKDASQIIQLTLVPIHHKSIDYIDSITEKIFSMAPVCGEGG